MLAKSFKINFAQIIFRRNRRVFQNVSDKKIFVTRRGEIESRGVNVLSETHDINSFAILRRSEIFAVQNFVADVVADLLKGIANDFERAPFVVIDKPLDVLAKNNFRLVIIANPHHVEKKRPATNAVIIVVETCAASGNRKGLARKTRQTNIKRRNFRLVNFGDVAFNRRAVRKIFVVSRAGVFIDFADKNRLGVGSENIFKGKPNPAYSREQVNHLVHLPASDFFCATVSATIRTHLSTSFLISLPKNLKTVQPSAVRRSLTSRSRAIFRSIFGIQNSW